MDNIFAELSIIILVATVIAGLMQAAKQPLIIGHIITGLIVGPHFLNVLQSTEILSVFSQIGIALLLFIIGLSLSPKVITEVGKPAAITGLLQVTITTLIGFFVSRSIGFTLTESLYIAIALTFSSTIIILKLLSDKKDLGRLYAKITVGILLVQDVVATLILVGVSASNQGADAGNLLLDTVLKGAVLIALFSAVTVFVLPKLSAYFAKSQEFLFLFAMAWGLGLATLFQIMGFSIEIGALFAGIGLATSPYNYEISARMKPLRDFFIVLFFIIIGSQINISHLGGILYPTLILSLFVLIGKPLIITTLTSLLGYNKKTSFRISMTLPQVSEFSLILVILANKVGHLSPEIVSLVTLVGIVTIAASTYLILYGDKIYALLSPYLSILEHSTQKEEIDKEQYDIILFGFDHVGYDLLKSFKKLDTRFLVVDYDPEIIDTLTNEKIPCRYGDANDNEFLDELGLKSTKLVVSTITDFETNQLVINQVKSASKKAVVIVKSDTIHEASALYEQGASYVMMPHFISTNFTSVLIDKHGFDLSEFLKEKEKHVRYLEKRKELIYHKPLFKHT